MVLAAAVILLKNKQPSEKAEEENMFLDEPFLIEAKQTEQQWERLEFFPVSDTNRFYHYLKGLPIQGAESQFIRPFYQWCGPIRKGRMRRI